MRRSGKVLSSRIVSGLRLDSAILSQVGTGLKINNNALIMNLYIYLLCRGLTI
jgi:hypothetical protein